MTTYKQKYYCMRPMILEDVEIVSKWFEHLADLSIFDRNTPIPTNSNIVAENWKEVLSTREPRQGYWFGIEDQTGKLVGIGGIENISYVNGDAILALFMADEVRRKGIARLVCGVVLDLAFDQLRLNRITSYYREDNQATEKLTRTVGFEIEGTKRKGWFSGGNYLDVITVGILASEWQNARTSLVENLGETKKIQFGRPPWSARLWPEKLA